MKVIYISIALLKNEQGAYLITSRPEGKPLAGMFELPGGKIDEGETPEHAMVRELKEELDILVCEDDLKPLTFLSHTYDAYHVVMFVYEIEKWSGEIKALEGQDHMAWATLDQFHAYPMLEADIVLLEQLQKYV